MVMEGVPFSRSVLFGEVDQQAGDIGIVRNKSSVEVGKTKEGSNVFDLRESWPFCNAVQFYWVHGKLSWSDDHSQIFYLCSCKGTFFQF